MVDIGEPEKPRKKTNYFQRIKDFALIVAVFFILYILLFAKNIDQKDKEWSWAFLIVIVGVIAVMYLLVKRKKVWNPYEVVNKIERMSNYAGKLNTAWDAWEVWQSDRNPKEKLFYFKKSETPYLINWNVVEECISEITLLTPLMYNKIAKDNKRLDAYFKEQQRGMAIEKLEKEEGIVADQENYGEVENNE